MYICVYMCIYVYIFVYTSGLRPLASFLSLSIVFAFFLAFAIFCSFPPPWRASRSCRLGQAGSMGLIRFTRFVGFGWAGCLLAACCLLLAASRLLLVACCLLFAACCLLLV